VVVFWVQHQEVGALVILFLFVALAVLSRYAVDSRRQRDRVDRYWWPEG